MTLEDDLRAAIRTIPDYPKPGILFRDITTLLGNARAFRRAVDELVHPFAGTKIDKVAGIEARGFILGAPSRTSFRPASCRSARRASCRTERRIAYSLEYGIDEMEMHTDAVTPGEKVMLIDDLVATGGTAKAAVKYCSRSAPKCRRLLRHRPAGSRRPGEDRSARRAGANADRVRRPLALANPRWRGSQEFPASPGALPRHWSSSSPGLSAAPDGRTAVNRARCWTARSSCESRRDQFSASPNLPSSASTSARFWRMRMSALGLLAASRSVSSACGNCLFSA